MRAKERLLSPVRPTGTDDPDFVILPLGPDDEDQAATDWSNGDEAILIQRMGVVEELEMIHA